MNETVILGKNNGIPVFMDTEHAPNKHIAIVGASGGGKTVEAQNIIRQIAEHGGTSIIFDTHGSLSNDQIFEPYRPIFDKYRNDIDTDETGIPCHLYEPVLYPDGRQEKSLDTASAVADIFSRAMKLGPKQSAVMRSASESVMYSRAYYTDGINALGVALKRMGTPMASELYERLHHIFKHNALVDGEGIFEEGKINIIHFSKLSLDTQEILAEVVLAYIWRLANADQFKEKPIYVFIDECQNYNNEPKSSLALAISEGRRMGINLILSTQMILQGTTNAVQQRISQCGLILYCIPASNRINLTARMINPASVDEWAIRLRDLKVGQFIATGNFKVGGRPIDYPVIIDAREEIEPEESDEDI